MGYSPRYHFYTSQWPNHHSETDDWAVIESEIKSARESGSTPADYSGYVIDTHTGKRTDFGLKGIVENSDVPPPPEPREPAAREAEKWLLEYPQAIAIRNEWGPDICFYSHEQTIELLEAYSAELRAERDDYRHKWNDVLAHEDKALANCRKLERSLLQAREAKDGAYAERDNLVAALSKLFPSGLERHPDSDTTWENDWRWIVFIDLPTGQATWHIHDSELAMFDHLPRFTGRTWDGHTTPQKYLRLAALASTSAPEGTIHPSHSEKA